MSLSYSTTTSALPSTYPKQPKQLPRKLTFDLDSAQSAAHAPRHIASTQTMEDYPGLMNDEPFPVSSPHRVHQAHPFTPAKFRVHLDSLPKPSSAETLFPSPLPTRAVNARGRHRRRSEIAEKASSHSRPARLMSASGTKPSRLPRNLPEFSLRRSSGFFSTSHSRSAIIAGLDGAWEKYMPGISV